jgi:hypothetical protein
MPVTYCNDPADPQVRERIREEWSKDFFEHEKQVAERLVVEARWAWEDERHAVQLREWEHERIQHELELEERARREEEERRRLGLFWGHVEAHQCKTYGTREYTAVLMNLPMNWEQRVEACKATPLEVHGITHMPKSCEDKVRGTHWKMLGWLTLLGTRRCHWSMGDRPIRTRLQDLLELVQRQGKSLVPLIQCHPSMLTNTPGLHITWIRKEGGTHLLNIVPFDRL